MDVKDISVFCNGDIWWHRYVVCEETVFIVLLVEVIHSVCVKQSYVLVALY